jgi:hypothetical protein
VAGLPQVLHALTLSSFVPSDQDQKIAAIKAVGQRLGRALNPPQRLATPTGHGMACFKVSRDVEHGQVDVSGCFAPMAGRDRSSHTRRSQISFAWQPSKWKLIRRAVVSPALYCFASIGELFDNGRRQWPARAVR